MIVYIDQFSKNYAKVTNRAKIRAYENFAQLIKVSCHENKYF